MMVFRCQPSGRGEFLKLLPQDRGHRISMIVHTQCQTPTAFRSTETPPIEASNRAMGWTDRGIFDGDGHNDVLGRDGVGNLHLYPGDGDGGWLPPKQVGSGWNIFDSIVGPGDFNGDGVNDVLARDRQGNLHLYPGDGAGGWNTPLLVGHGRDIFKDLI